jgi:hypothetical protein
MANYTATQNSYQSDLDELLASSSKSTASHLANVLLAGELHVPATESRNRTTPSAIEHALGDDQNIKGKSSAHHTWQRANLLRDETPSEFDHTVNMFGYAFLPANISSSATPIIRHRIREAVALWNLRSQTL